MGEVIKMITAVHTMQVFAVAIKHPVEVLRKHRRCRRALNPDDERLGRFAPFALGGLC
jgi:hypothetical protein